MKYPALGAESVPMLEEQLLFILARSALSSLILLLKLLAEPVVIWRPQIEKSKSSQEFFASISFPVLTFSEIVKILLLI